MKLQRAEEHFGDLVARHQGFQERNPYRMLLEVDAEPGYNLWRAKIVEHPPLEQWSAIVGDCVHALRSALDHTAYALVQIAKPGTTYTEFPIIKDKYTTRNGDVVLRWPYECVKKLPSVERRAIAQVKWLQPYRRRDGDERFHPLWLIHEMDVIDKHRRLNLVKPFVRHVEYVTRGCEIVSSQQLAGPFEDGTEISRYKAVPTGPEMHVQANFAFDILFGEDEPLQGEPVMQRLQGLLATTGYIIGRFDRFFV